LAQLVADPRALGTPRGGLDTTWSATVPTAQRASEASLVADAAGVAPDSRIDPGTSRSPAASTTPDSISFVAQQAGALIHVGEVTTV